jgi:chromosome transmission fidelity protein 4
MTKAPGEATTSKIIPSTPLPLWVSIAAMRGIIPSLYRDVDSAGERGIVYAAAAEPGHPAVVHYRAYDAWASQSDWQVNLPEGEDVILVASGGRLPESNYDDDFTVGNVVVGTTKGYVRFFSGSGLQRYLWRMGEELVSMVAGKDLLFMIHREGGTSLDGCQNLRFTLIDLVTFDVVQDGRIPLPKRTTLTWVGFAEYGVSARLTVLTATTT